MTQRVLSLVRNHELSTAVGAASLLGVLVTLVPRMDRALLLVASVGLLLALGALVVWLVQAPRGLEWTTSAGAAERVRGSDRRITALARRIDAALTGDESARTDVQVAVRSVAEARLTQLGLPPTTTDPASRTALGPALTAYVSSASPPRVGAAELATFITTLEEH